MEKVPHYLKTAIEALALILAALRAILELMDCDERAPEDRTPLPHPGTGAEELPF